MNTRGPLLAVVLALCALVSCSGAPAPPPAPEHPHLRLGVLPIVDDAHLVRAQAAGYFKAEGLTVDLVTVQGGAAALPRLAAGDLDMTFTNYVSALLAQAQGAGTFRFVDGGYQAGPNTLLIITQPGSAIRSPRDLARKKIAVNTRRNIVELTARSALETAGVDPGSVTFVEVPFPEMAAALQSGKVDAAFTVEPFSTQAALAFGAVSTLDASAGATAGIPIGGVAVTADFVAKNPDTVAAVRRALARAQADMADRSVVEQILPTYTKITSDTAALIALGTWPATLDTVRLRRDVDLMRQYGVLTTDLDVGSMVLPR
jgi:NitT/TauT family transport system substrate-binding protein